MFDLAAVLGLPRGASPQRMLVAERRGLRAGFAVDEVTDVDGLPEAEQETGSDLLSSAVLVDGALVGVIDVDRLFDVLGSRRMSQPEAEFFGIFRDEANERLDSMAAALLAIEAGRAPADASTASSAMRTRSRAAPACSASTRSADWRMRSRTCSPTARAQGELPAGLADPLLRACDALRALVNGAEPSDPVAARGSRSRSSRPDPRASPQSRRRMLRPRPPRRRCASSASARPRRRRPRAPRPPRRRSPSAAAPLRARGRGGTRCAFRPRSSTPCSTSSARRCSIASGSATSSQPRERGRASELADELDVGDRLLGALQDAAIRMRTLPFGSITGPFPRAVRDMAGSRGQGGRARRPGHGDRARPRDPRGAVRAARPHPPQHGRPRHRARRGTHPRGQARARPRRARGGAARAASWRSSSPTTAAASRPSCSPRRRARARSWTSSRDRASRRAARSARWPGAASASTRSRPTSRASAAASRSRASRARAVRHAALAAHARAARRAARRARRPCLRGAARERPGGRRRDGDALARRSHRARAARRLGALRRSRGGPRRRRAAAPAARARDRRRRRRPSRGARLRSPGRRVRGRRQGPRARCSRSVSGYLGAAILGDGRSRAPRRSRRACTSAAARARERCRRGGRRAGAAARRCSSSRTPSWCASCSAASSRPRATTSRPPGTASRRSSGSRPTATIDLVVTDVDMPEMDGLALTAAIRASAEWRAVPVIVVTSRHERRGSPPRRRGRRRRVHGQGQLRPARAARHGRDAGRHVTRAERPRVRDLRGVAELRRGPPAC